MSGRVLVETDAPMPDPEARKSTMLPRKPEDWPRLFVQHPNSGDLEAVVALYPPNARFVPTSGETIVGRDSIRDVLARMIRSKTKLQSHVMKAISADDVAVLYTDFQGTAMDASEKTIDVRYNAIEVLRQQPDGCWKLIAGGPNGYE